MIDSMYQDGTDKVLDDMVRRPRPDLPPEQGFSTLGALRGVPRGIAGGVANTIAFGAEVSGAFGQVAGATGYGGSADGMFSLPTEQEKKQREEARRKLIDTGPQFSNEAGDIFRTRAKDIMPDPTSTHASEQVIAGITQFATQAVGYALTTGGAAPLLLGADVGLAESDKLKQQGVDLATRTKAGAVAGGTAALSIALPVAVPGSIAKTAAAVAVGGPGSFVAQNVAERAILENGGYEKIASTYDPFDPVGLALSTLVPAGFGAVAVRGARVTKSATTIHQVVQQMESGGRRFGKDGKILEGPQTKYGTAKGEMQVVDSTNLDPGFGVRPAADNSPAERARVGSDYLDAMVKRYGGDEAKAMAAYNWGPGNLDGALAKAQKSGGDWRALLPEETRNYVSRGTEMLQGGRIGAAADADAVAAARTRQTAQVIDSYRITPDGDLAGMTRHQQAMERAHDQMAAGNPVEVAGVLRLADEPLVNILDSGQYLKATTEAGSVGGALKPDGLHINFAEVADEFKGQGKGVELYTALIDEAHARGLRVFSDSTVETPAARVYEALARRGYELKRSEGGGELAPSPETPEGALYGKGATEPVYEVGRRVDRPAELARALVKVFEPPPAPRAPAAARAAPAKAEAPGGTPAAPATAKAAPAEPGGQAKADAPDPQLEARAQQVSDEMPDLMVQLEGMDAPVRASELLERIKKEAADETQDASLLDVAATCFLRQQ